MDVSCVCCVLSDRGLCDELITWPQESYRLWRVVVCDHENLLDDEAIARAGLQSQRERERERERERDPCMRSGAKIGTTYKHSYIQYNYSMTVLPEGPSRSELVEFYCN
jgi:hypothetical protein